jgi:hypothetical protein
MSYNFPREGEKGKAMRKEEEGQNPRFGTANFERRRHPRFSVDLPVEYWQINRNPKNHWQELEYYIAEHSSAEITHGILCPECREKYSKRQRQVSEGGVPGRINYCVSFPRYLVKAREMTIPRKKLR